MFAVVDIETTGHHVLGNGITEIAIVLHNGKEFEGTYETLINPCIPIQKFVQTLTGITDTMVATAPLFSSVAPNIYNLLKDRIFVAHNVGFDYPLVRQQLLSEGFVFDTPKLCTIKLSKKIFPGLTKYCLETICKELNIPLNSRHRALGDAMATAHLLSLLIQNDYSSVIAKTLKIKPHLIVKRK